MKRAQTAISRAPIIAVAIALGATAACFAAAGTAWADTVLSESDGAVYCIEDGVTVTSSWKTIDGAKYYFKSDGKAATGACTISSKTWIFDSKGKLSTGTAQHTVKVGTAIYRAEETGQAAKKGWTASGTKLYYVGSKGKCTTSKKYKGIVLQPNGVARNNDACKLKIQSMKIISSITTSKMTKGQKLRACWNYLNNKGRFHFSLTSPNISSPQWWMSSAYRFFSTKRGDCYSFSCGFAALAAEVGYEPKIVYGRVSGSRDGASDGLTRHCWVKIGNGFYDPEANFAGWMKGVYGSGSYPVAHQTKKTYDFYDMTGVSLTNDTANKKGLTIIDGKVYYFEDGKAIKSTWKIVKSKKYYFKSSGVAATGSCKIKNVYYIFSSGGVLQTGTSGKTVTVGSNVYRAKKNGTAYPGWTSDKTKYYGTTGKRAKGLVTIDGETHYFNNKTGIMAKNSVAIYKEVLYALNEEGFIDEEKSAQLNAIAVFYEDAAAFLKAAGVESASMVKDDGSCYRAGEGDDVTYTFENIIVSTFLPYDASEAEVLLDIQAVQ